MEEIDLFEYWQIMKRRWKYIAKITFILVVLASINLFVFTPRVYRGKAVILFPQSSDSASGLLSRLGGSMSMFAGLGGEAMNSPGMYAEILKSRTLNDQVIHALKLEPLGIDSDMLQMHMEVEIDKDGGMQICGYAPTTWAKSGKLKWLDEKYPKQNYKRQTAHLAADLTNEYIHQLEDYEKKHAFSEGRRKRLFVESEVAKTKVELSSAEETFRKFREENPMAPPPETMSDQVKQIIDLKTKQIENENQLKMTENSISEAKKIIGGQEEVLTAARVIQENPVVSGLKSDLANAEVQKATLLQNYTDIHPDVVGVEQRIEQIKKKISVEVPNATESETRQLNPIRQNMIENLAMLEIQESGYQAGSKAMEDTMAKIEKEVSGLAKVQLQYVRLERDVKALEIVYTSLLGELSQAKISEAKEPDRFSVMDWAEPEKFHYRPKVKLVLGMVMLFGLMMGSVLAIVKESKIPAAKRQQMK